MEAADGHLLFPLIAVLGEQLNRSAAALDGGDALHLARRLGIVDVDLDVGVAISRAAGEWQRLSPELSRARIEGWQMSFDDGVEYALGSRI
jgi:hypothetical protein